MNPREYERGNCVKIQSQKHKKIAREPSRAIYIAKRYIEITKCYIKIT